MNSAVPMQEEVRHWMRRLLFVSAIWTALLTAILCAILPSGLPLTKMVGSAFSPSTTVVALRGRAEQIRSAVRVVKGDAEPVTRDALPGSHAVSIAAYAPVVQSSLPVQSSPFHPAIFFPLSRHAASEQPYPRGPPTA